MDLCLKKLYFNIRMGDRVANQYTVCGGRIGAVQLSDGCGLLTTSPSFYYDTSVNHLYANVYIGDGGLLSNLSTVSSVIPSSEYQIAYYNSNATVKGDSGFTYYQPTSTVTMGGSLLVMGDLFIGGNTYASNNVIFNDSIIEIGNNAPVNTTCGLLFDRPNGNIMMSYLSTENGSSYMNTLTFGYTFGSASGPLLIPDTSNNSLLSSKARN